MWVEDENNYSLKRVLVRTSIDNIFLLLKHTFERQCLKSTKPFRKRNRSALVETSLSEDSPLTLIYMVSFSNFWN